MDSDWVKPAKEVRIGQVIHIRSRDFEIEVTVQDLSNIHKGAPEAALLYKETPASIAKRENAKLTGENEFAQRDRSAGRPTKRQLRDIKKFTRHTDANGCTVDAIADVTALAPTSMK